MLKRFQKIGLLESIWISLKWQKNFSKKKSSNTKNRWKRIKTVFEKTSSYS